MMSSQNQTTPVQLAAMERDLTLNPRQLRSAGFVPATLYGKGMASQSIQVRTHDFEVLYGKGFRTFDLGAFGTAVAHQVQMNPVPPQRTLNIEFYITSPAGAKAPASKAPKEAVPA